MVHPVLVSTHWPVGTDGIVWLKHGLLHKSWWACLDSNQGHVLPILESLIPGYAAAMLEALEAGDLDDLARMLDLLEALGGPR